jgi:hypothetical protein
MIMILANVCLKSIPLCSRGQKEKKFFWAMGASAFCRKKKGPRQRGPFHGKCPPIAGATLAGARSATLARKKTFDYRPIFSGPIRGLSDGCGSVR